ncbi:MAG: alpha/beta hydrolase [Brachybacterium sp.]|nr:alpha/beta hydrolase [Brachybacterium sp.]
MGVAAVVVLALIGAGSVVTFFAGPPGVGHFTSAAGRAAYVGAYDEAMGLLPDPATTRDVPTSFGTVRVYEWAADPDGDTEVPPLVLMPGRASGAPMWAQNLPHLLGSRRIIVFDLLGDAGLSTQTVPMRNTADAALWMDELFAEIAPEGVHLVGHSFGGAYAMAYALAHPERIHSLALLEPVFTFAAPPADLLAWTVVSSLPLLPDPWREHALSRVGGADYDPTDPIAQMVQAGTQHYSADLPQPQVLTSDQISAVQVPVYVALGDRDSLAGGEAAEKAASELPNGTVEVWSDSTHSLPMQNVREIGQHLLTFAAQHDPL